MTPDLQDAGRPAVRPRGRTLVLGAAGFIGRHLAAALAADARPPTELLLADRQAPLAPRAAAAQGVPVRSLQGDVTAPAFLDALFARGIDTVFHLAASLTLEAEADFDHGWQVNVDTLVALMRRCRALPAPPAFVFASSIATFGGALPDPVDDHVPQRPETSYGMHKVIAELLIDDASRRGFVDGRVLRLPVVLTHPGPASGSVSDRLAALIREPLAGRDADSPLAPDTRFPVASVQSVVRALLALSALPSGTLGPQRAMNLPSLSVTPAEISRAVAAAGATGRTRAVPDAAMQRIVDGWPRAFVSARASALGLAADASVDALVQAHRGRDDGP